LQARSEAAKNREVRKKNRGRMRQVPQLEKLKNNKKFKNKELETVTLLTRKFYVIQ